MESLPKDLINKTALNLELPEILNLCQTSTKFDQTICQNEIFWMNKTNTDYPDVQNLSLYGSNYRQIYKNLYQPITIPITFIGTDQTGYKYTETVQLEFPKTVMNDMGKYVCYIISAITDGILVDNTFTIVVDGLECITEEWHPEIECFRKINYDTKKITVIAQTISDTTLEYSIENIPTIERYVERQFNISTDKWEPLWL